MGDSFQCPVCESYTLDCYGDYDICTVCNWEDCGYMRDNPDETSGANWLTLNQAKANWKKHGVVMTEKDYAECRAHWAEMRNETQK